MDEKTPKDLTSPHAVDFGSHADVQRRFARIWAEVEDVLPVHQPIQHRKTHDNIMYRTSSGGMGICRTHVVECGSYRFHGKELRVVAVGPRERMYSLIQTECTMCITNVVYDNVCLNCQTPLHPQWPAVYCTGACAMEDR